MTENWHKRMSHIDKDLDHKKAPVPTTLGVVLGAVLAVASGMLVIALAVWVALLIGPHV